MLTKLVRSFRINITSPFKSGSELVQIYYNGI